VVVVSRAVSSEAEPPLARLFAIAYRQLIDDLHRQLRVRGWHDVRPAYGFALLAAREAPITVTALADTMGMTKQAASKLVEAMVDGGFLDRATGSADGRVRPFRLSRRGRRLLSAVEDIYVELERAWADRIGDAALDRLRADLQVAVAAPDGSLPAIRPVW
jgi:DNA-binding MarR family transcriptional regulator